MIRLWGIEPGGEETGWGLFITVLLVIFRSDLVICVGGRKVDGGRERVSAVSEWPRV